MDYFVKFLHRLLVLVSNWRYFNFPLVLHLIPACTVDVCAKAHMWHDLEMLGVRGKVFRHMACCWEIGRIYTQLTSSSFVMHKFLRKLTIWKGEIGE